MISIDSHKPPAIVCYNKDMVIKNKDKGDLALLRANEVLSNFNEISSIYRESGRCSEISNYLQKKLKLLGFDIKVTKDGSICATRGLNQTKDNAVILQAHMDMVAVSKDKNPKKPIKTRIKDGWLYANARTLGADDGIGVSAILAIASDERFKTYPLEMIITTDEETSMIGAKALKPEDFYGKYLINLDSELLGVITKGCAGSVNYGLNEKISMLTLDNNKYSMIRIKITGAKGGHSAEIDKSTLNPLKTLVSVLNNSNYMIVSIDSGDKFNSVPICANAEFLVLTEDKQKIKNSLVAFFDKLQKEYAETNPDLKISVTSGRAKPGLKYVEGTTQKRLLNNLDAITIGVVSIYNNGTNKTSQNLGVLKLSNGNCVLKIMGRSSDPTGEEGKVLKDKTIDALTKAFNKKILPSDEIPTWSAKSNSNLEKAASEAYVKVTGGEFPKILIEHGGLEPAVFSITKPELEQISIGPTVETPHSINERLKIDTVEPFYNWLTKTLELLQKK